MARRSHGSPITTTTDLEWCSQGNSMTMRTTCPSGVSKGPEDTSQPQPLLQHRPQNQLQLQSRNRNHNQSQPRDLNPNPNLSLNRLPLSLQTSLHGSPSV